MCLIGILLTLVYDAVVTFHRNDTRFPCFDVTSSLEVEVWVFCADRWFGDDCAVFCRPADTDASGHFYCDPDNGQKICLQGTAYLKKNIVESLKYSKPRTTGCNEKGVSRRREQQFWYSYVFTHLSHESIKLLHFRRRRDITVEEKSCPDKMTCTFPA